MLAKMDGTDTNWCDIEGRPVANRYKKNHKSKSRSISGLLLRFGTLALATLYCSSQFHTLRRLTQEGTLEGNNNIDTANGFDMELELESPRTITRQTRSLTPLPVSAERQFGTSLMGRILEEKLRSKTTTTTTEKATRTRTVGAAANAKRVLWPVLQGNPSGVLLHAPKRQVPSVDPPTTTTSATSTTTTGDTAVHIRTLGTTTNNNPNNFAWPVLLPGVAGASATSYNGTTTTATATRTRTTGAAAAASNRKRITWPVLSIPLSGAATTTYSSGSSTALGYESSESDGANTLATSATVEPMGTYKIVGFADYNYRDVALRWYQRLEDMGYQEHILIAYDNAMGDHLQSLNEERAYELAMSSPNETTPEYFEGIRVDQEEQGNGDTATTIKSYSYRFEKHLLPPLPKQVLRLRRHRRYRKRREMILAWRWHYVLGQLQAGTSILLTDVDNVFHKHNALSEDPDFAGFDVLHAYDGMSPQHVYEQIGFTVHGGMTWLKATPSTIAFVRKLVDHCGIMCDDQTVLNEMIADPKVLGIEWDANHGNNDHQRPPTRDNRAAPVSPHDTSPLPSESRTGRSTVTGHTVKIWDRERVFTGDPRKPLECPNGSENGHGSDSTWIAMSVSAVEDPDEGPTTAITSHLDKLAFFDFWDEGCGRTVQDHNNNDDDNETRMSGGVGNR